MSNDISNHILNMDFVSARNAVNEIKHNDDLKSLTSRADYYFSIRNFCSALEVWKLIIEKFPVVNFKIGAFLKVIRVFYFSGNSAIIRDLIFNKLTHSSSSDNDKMLLIICLAELGEQYLDEFIKVADVECRDDDKFFLDRLPITNGSYNSSTEQEFLFISGVPRSGTTALGNFLNLHPDVALTLERFGFGQGFHPAMFAENIVFHNEQYKIKYSDLFSKFKKAKYIGDKRPNFLHSWSITKKHFEPEKIKIIHFVRDPYLVAQSYLKRSSLQSKGLDSWSSNSIVPRDHFFACHDMNLNNTRALEIAQDPNFKSSIKIIDSEKFYSDVNNVIDVLNWLGLEVSDYIKVQAEIMVGKSAEIKKKTFVSDNILEFVDRFYNFEKHNSLLKLC